MASFNMFKRAAVSSLIAAQIGIIGVPNVAVAAKMHRHKAVVENMTDQAQITQEKKKSLFERNQKIYNELLTKLDQLISVRDALKKLNTNLLKGQSMGGIGSSNQVLLGKIKDILTSTNSRGDLSKYIKNAKANQELYQTLLDKIAPQDLESARDALKKLSNNLLAEGKDQNPNSDDNQEFVKVLRGVFTTSTSQKPLIEYLANAKEIYAATTIPSVKERVKEDAIPSLKPVSLGLKSELEQDKDHINDSFDDYIKKIQELKQSSVSQDIDKIVLAYCDKVSKDLIQSKEQFSVGTLSLSDADTKLRSLNDAIITHEDVKLVMIEFYSYSSFFESGGDPKFSDIFNKSWNNSARTITASKNSDVYASIIGVLKQEAFKILDERKAAEKKNIIANYQGDEQKNKLTELDALYKFKKSVYDQSNYSAYMQDLEQKMRILSDIMMKSISLSSTPGSFEDALRIYKTPDRRTGLSLGEDYSLLNTYVDMNTILEALKNESVITEKDGKEETHKVKTVDDVALWLEQNLESVRSTNLSRFKTLRTNFGAFSKENANETVSKTQRIIADFMSQNESKILIDIQKRMDADPSIDNINYSDKYAQHSTEVRDEYLRKELSSLGIDPNDANLEKYKSELFKAASRSENAVNIDVVFSKMSIIDLYLFGKIIDRVNENNYTDPKVYNGIIKGMSLIAERDPYLLTSYLEYAIPGMLEASKNNEKAFIKELDVANATHEVRIPKTIDFQQRANLRLKFESIKNLSQASDAHTHNNILFDDGGIWNQATTPEGTGYYSTRTSSLLDYTNFTGFPSLSYTELPYNLSPHIFRQQYDGVPGLFMPTVAPNPIMYHALLASRFNPSFVSNLFAVPAVNRLQRLNEVSLINELSKLLAKDYFDVQYSNIALAELIEAAAAGKQDAYGTTGGIVGRYNRETALGGNINATGLIQYQNEIAPFSPASVYLDEHSQRTLVLTQPVHSTDATVRYNKQRELSEGALQAFVPIAAKNKADMLVYTTWTDEEGGTKESRQGGWYLVKQNGEIVKWLLKQNPNIKLNNLMFGEVNLSDLLVSAKGYTDSKSFGDLGKAVTPTGFEGAAFGFTLTSLDAAAAGVTRNITFADHFGNEHAFAVSKEISGESIVIATYRGYYEKGENKRSLVEVKYRDVPANISLPAKEITGIFGKTAQGLTTIGSQMKTENMFNLDGAGGTLVNTGINSADIYQTNQEIANRLVNLYGWKRNEADNYGQYASITGLLSQLKESKVSDTYYSATVILWLHKLNFLGSGQTMPAWVNNLSQIGNDLENGLISYDQAVSKINSIFKSKDISKYALGLGYDNKVYFVATTDLDKNTNMKGYWLFKENNVLKQWAEASASSYAVNSGSAVDLAGGFGLLKNKFSLVANAGPTLLVSPDVKFSGISGTALLKFPQKVEKYIKSELISGISAGYKNLPNADLNELQLTFSGINQDFHLIRENRVTSWYAFFDGQHNKIMMVPTNEVNNIWEYSATLGYEFAGLATAQREGNSVALHVTGGHLLDATFNDFYGGGGVTWTTYNKIGQNSVGFTIGVGPMSIVDTHIWDQTFYNSVDYGRFKDWGFKIYYKRSF